MRIERIFTAPAEDGFARTQWRSISIEICHTSSAQRLCIPNFEVPSHWSDKAAEHLARHYVRRTGVPSQCERVAEEGVPDWMQRHVPASDCEMGAETSARQLIERLVGAWTYWGWGQGYFDTEEDARNFYDEQCYLIVNQRAMPASPQWSSTGLHWAYGLEGDAQGSYFVDTDSGELGQCDNAFERPQHHHYFIQGVNDVLSGDGGIADLLQREMRVFKHGSGSGCNMSAIRGACETLSSGMAPAGLAAFMQIGDEAALALSGSTLKSETASKLSIVDCDHPDVMRLVRSRLAAHRERIATSIGSNKQRLFYQWVVQAVENCSDVTIDAYNPEQNVALGQVVEKLRARQVSDTLIAEYLNELRACEGKAHGFCDNKMPSEETASTSSVAKLGLRLSDNFMRAAASGQDWALSRRTDSSFTERFSADKMLAEMAHYNWLTGEGFIAFADHINQWHGCHEAGPIRASSPGGEFLFLDDTACDVAVINLLPLLNDDGALDLAAYEHTVRLQTIMCDIAITMAQFPSKDIAYNSYRFRPIGLSMCNLAALLMAMGYAYDSSEGRNLAAAMAAIMTAKAYVTSADIARELGSFEAFSEVRDGMMRLMWQHHEAAFGRTQHLGRADSCPPVIDHSALPDGALSDAVQRLWDEAMIRGDEFGYSNAQVSLIAASPNVMSLMDALAPGISALSVMENSPAMKRVINAGLNQLGYACDQRKAITGYLFGRHAGLNTPGINAEMLLGRGFTGRELELIEDALARGQHVHAAFDPLHLGERFCRSVLHLSDAQLYDANFKLLHHLGFDEEAVALFEASLEGHESAAGAPFLREEDYAIFALADPATELSIGIEAQVEMAASVQPYVSGGIAMPITTPYNVSVAKHRHVMMTAWQLGLKQLMLTRAPLPAAQKMAEETAQQTETPKPVSIDLPQGTLKPKLAIERSIIAAMSIMKRPSIAVPQMRLHAARNLPARRRSYVQEAMVGDVLVRHRTEEYEGGALGAVHLELPELETNLSQALAHQADILSVALQHGVPLEAFAELSSARRYNPHGDVTGHGKVTLSQCVFDYLLQDLLPAYAPDEAADALDAELGALSEQRDVMVLKSAPTSDQPTLTQAIMPAEPVDS